MKYTLQSSREFYNSQPGKRASAAMIVRHDGRYLMIKHDYKDVMTFPSGINDPDESPKTTAIRETNEEVGLDLSANDVAFCAAAYVGELYGFKERFHFFFAVDIDAEQAGKLVFEEGVEGHEWVTIDLVAERAGNRDNYVQIQQILQSGQQGVYFEVDSQKAAA